MESPAFIAKTELPGQEKDAWNSLWVEGDTFWDLGQAHPYLPLLLKHKFVEKELNIKKATVFIPGCGNGHEAAYMARQGAIVSAADYSPVAIEAASKKYGDIKGLEFNKADAFQTPIELRSTADIIIDRAMLCAIEPNNRTKYMKACAERLKGDGLFLSVAFKEVKIPNGPPYTLSRNDLEDFAQEDFDILYCEPKLATTMTEYIHSELLVILKKKNQNEFN